MRARRRSTAHGLALVPGLVDAHQHPLIGADETDGADLAGLTTIEAVRTALAAEHARCGPGRWVRGHSLEYATFDGVELSGELVADAVGGAPALLTFLDFHTALATPAALAAAGIDGPRALEGSAEIVCRDGRPRARCSSRRRSSRSCASRRSRRTRAPPAPRRHLRRMAALA